ncbi:MAG TPA: Spy/CpxP family protein refolding chaperone [Candidatus Acidoferrales bacterium]|nr:Spy/CpxP family protein refolding chaperone [Candidatus Acidoferrales bacterium]
MKTVWMGVAVLGCLSLASAGQTQQPSAEMQHHHSCLEEERASIERGEGFGMAMPADHAGYPGPRHVLDMASELHLTVEQRAGMEKIYNAMKEKALVRGKELFESEARLEQMFRDARTEADLREQSFRVDTIHAELRWIHLSAHLAAQKILTPEQIATYTRLRHAQM